MKFSLRMFFVGVALLAVAFRGGYVIGWYAGHTAGRDSAPAASYTLDGKTLDLSRPLPKVD